VPGAPLIQLLYLTQALNAVLLLPLMAFMYVIARDRTTMGALANSRRASVAQMVVLVLVAVCVAALAVVTVAG
jgi:Mn2+/Fe2+ NRAMP family transporter